MAITIGGALVPFVFMFRQQGEAETRVLTCRNHPVIPDDEYGLMESFCPDLQCDCRRVILNVMARRQQAVLASISYGFDRETKLAGPFLDPLNPQSKYAHLFLTVVEDVLSDPAYVARLEAHYDQVKRAAADPNHPVQPLLARLARADKRRRGVSPRRKQKRR